LGLEGTGRASLPKKELKAALSKIEGIYVRFIMNFRRKKKR